VSAADVMDAWFLKLLLGCGVHCCVMRLERAPGCSALGLETGLISGLDFKSIFFVFAEHVFALICGVGNRKS
jgi:hypothetical protein